MLIHANPAAEASKEFEAVKPGTYVLRIKEVKDRNSEGKNDLEVSMEHTTPNAELIGLNNEPIKGIPQGLFDYVMLADDKQWKLRQITEAAGLAWTDYDPVVDLQGKEVTVVLKNEMYEGQMKNKVVRYVLPKK